MESRPLAPEEQRTRARATLLVASITDWFTRVGTAKAGVAVFAGFAAVYLATAAYSSTQSVDTVAAGVPAWKVVEHGTLRVDEFQRAAPWFISTPNGVFSNRFPGVIFVAVPLYVVAGALGLSVPVAPTLVPAGMTAALITAGAMGVLYAVFSRLVPAKTALIAVCVAGLGTGTWSVSAHALWTHGPAQLYLAAGMLGFAGHRYAPAGVAHALAIFTRPHLAVVPLVSGIWETVRQRSLRPALVLGVISAAGLAGVIVYNAIIFGDPALTAGYGPTFGENLTGMSATTYLVSWVMTLVSPLRGIVPYSPFLLASVPCIREAWRESPAWVRHSAVAGIAYMAVQLRLSRWSGGDAFLGYRLSIEMLTLLAPLLLVSARLWLTGHPGRQTAFRVAVVWAVALQAFGATAYLSIAPS